MNATQPKITKTDVNTVTLRRLALALKRIEDLELRLEKVVGALKRGLPHMNLGEGL